MVRGGVLSSLHGSGGSLIYYSFDYFLMICRWIVLSHGLRWFLFLSHGLKWVVPTPWFWVSSLPISRWVRFRVCIDQSSRDFQPSDFALLWSDGLSVDLLLSHGLRWSSFLSMV
ncbi:hypothetical protein AVEN_7732-1 [Araneus ventricosus]|uniref:Uncharacterized protein n=1 Tax=Araneus ventricosus TaxID=182803 RepID=A0A4Y2RTE8_ARAVE|nr:hypothetical protein AVEN_7732-1 [Araneus ventricosus]